jgi:hypothetical protein
MLYIITMPNIVLIMQTTKRKISARLKKSLIVLELILIIIAAALQNA